MKTILTLMLFILLIISVSCEVKCEKLFIRHASSCCLDNNTNNICDSDEQITNIKPVPTVEPTEKKEEQPKPEIIEEIPVIMEQKSEPNVSFSIQLTPVKSSIRLIDQAVYKMTVFNLDKSLDQFVISTDDNKWFLSTAPLAQPIKLAVAQNSKNYIKLVFQPNKKFISQPGNYSVKLDVTSTLDSQKTSINASVEID